jgi:thymidylate synthase (FAD)
MDRIKVLDKGFVELLEFCASDLSVVNAARVSLHKESSEMEEKDKGLIKYLMRERHGTPFEQGYFKFRVKAPIFVFREWHRHRIGWCLPGSSLITTQRNFDSKKRTIEELWKLKHEGVKDNKGRTRILPSCQHPSLRVLNDNGRFTVIEARDIFQSGFKDIIEIFHEKGTLKCTPDHHIYTYEGWKKAEEIEVGDIIGIQGRVWREEDRTIPPSLRRGIGVWTSMQRKFIINEFDFCYKCGKIYNFDELELDHIVPVSKNLKTALDVDNIAPICVSCHAKKTFSKEQPSRKGKGYLGVVGSKINKKWKRVSHEMSYDIETFGPHHNFIADGVIVHNSYNEWSARYSELEPDFYIPSIENVVTQVGKPGHYIFEKADEWTTKSFITNLKLSSQKNYKSYMEALDNGIAKQQARLFLPVNTYSEMITTCNPRSLMHFLSLRNSEQAQAEIRNYAQALEQLFSDIMVTTHTAFVENNRQAP